MAKRRVGRIAPLDRAGEPVVVLGLGNPLRRDDGLGLHALRRLAQRCRLPDSVRLVEAGTLALALLDRVEGGERLLVLDAVGAGARPGSLVRLEGEAVPARLGKPASAHGLTLSDALALADLVGRAPGEVVVLGLQPSSTEPGPDLSKPVAEAIETLVEAAVVQLRRWGVSVGSR